MLAVIVKNIINYLQTNWLDLLYNFLLAAWVFLVIYFVIKRIVARVRTKIESNNLQSEEYNKKVSKLVWNMIFVLLMIFDVLAVFQVIWFDVAIIMWWVSLSLGFAMETTIWNVISGIMLLMNKKVKLGDYLEFLWNLKISWTVEEINLRYTIIKTFDKRRIIVPNSVIAKTPIKTLKSENMIRWDFQFRLPRSLDFDQIKKVLIQSINEIDGILHPEFSNVIIKWFDSYGLNLIWYFFVNPKKKRNKFAVTKDLRDKLLNIFKKYGIVVPCDCYVVNFE